MASMSSTATDIQMKKCRVDVNVGSQTYQGYTFLDFGSGQAMVANANGAVGSTGFSIWDDASTQRWVILEAGSDVETFESGVVDIQLAVLQGYLNGYTAAKNVSHTDKTSGATTALTNTINTINSAISGTLTLDQVNQYIEDIKSAGLTFLNNTKPADNAYYDLTFLIKNADFTDSAEGWSLDPARSYGSVEFYQTTFDLYQVLPDMPAGTYRFTADAFQRPGSNADVYTAYSGGTDNVNAVIYVNNSSQKIKNVMSGAQASSISNGEYTTDGGTYTPNNMESGSAYLNRNFYNNALEGEFAAGNLRVGLRGTVSNDGYWTMADNFRLYYMGADGVVLSLKEQLAANGFTKITALPSDYSPYLFVLYDHDQNLTMVLKNPNHQGGSKSMWYDADVNPMTSKEPLWTVDAYNGYQVLANATYPDYMLQTEYNAGWNYRCSDNGGGDAGWGRTTYTYLPDGYWTIQNGVYSEAGYLGPWDGTIEANAETALNKTDAAVGHFDIFTILRGDYVKRFDQSYLDATYDNPLDITYVLENPGGERRSTVGWKTTGAGWWSQESDALTGKVGSYFLESWHGGALEATDLYQEISGLPDGYYRFSAIAHCSANCLLYANSEEVAMPTNNPGTRTSVVVQIANDTPLRIGVKTSTNPGEWIAFDDAKLEYLGPLVTISDADVNAPPHANHAIVQLTRTLKGGQWNGFSVPFNIVDISALGTVKEFNSANDNEISFKDATEIIAGEPYIVKPAADVVNPVFNDVDVTNPEEAVYGDSDYKFAAHLYNTTLPTDGSVAYISTTDSSVKKLTSGGIKGMRSYFQIPTGSNVKALVLNFGDATAILDIEGNVTEGTIYNVAGQRVQDVRRGVYIMNGRKVLIK